MTATPFWCTVDEALEVRAVAETLVDAEEPYRLEAPVERRLDVGERHHLNAVDAQAGEVREPLGREAERLSYSWSMIS
jgi:hypothetical protein